MASDKIDQQKTQKNAGNITAAGSRFILCIGSIKHLLQHTVT